MSQSLSSHQRNGEKKTDPKHKWWLRSSCLLKTGPLCDRATEHWKTIVWDGESSFSRRHTALVQRMVLTTCQDCYWDQDEAFKGIRANLGVCGIWTLNTTSTRVDGMEVVSNKIPKGNRKKIFHCVITFTFELGRVGLCCNGKLEYVWSLKSVLNIDYQMYQTDRLRVLHRPVTSGFPHESYISESFTQFSVLHVFKLGTIVFHC